MSYDSLWASRGPFKEDQLEQVGLFCGEKEGPKVGSNNERHHLTGALANGP